MRIGCLICQYQDLARSGDGINADMSVNSFFGKCHIDVSRTYDLVYFWYTLGSECQSCNRLGTTHFVDFICSCLHSGNKCGRIHFSVLSARGRHDDLLHTCHFCRYNIHQNRRRINCFSTRNIDTDFCKWHDFLSEHGSVRFAVKPAVFFLFFVIFTNVNQCFSDNIQKRRINLFVSFVNLFFCHFDVSGIDIGTVKSFRIFKHCRIFVVSYILNDLCHSILEFSIAARAAFQQILKHVFSGFLCKCYCTHSFMPPV